MKAAGTKRDDHVLFAAVILQADLAARDRRQHEIRRRLTHLDLERAVDRLQHAGVVDAVLQRLGPAGAAASRQNVPDDPWGTHRAFPVPRDRRATSAVSDLNRTPCGMIVFPELADSIRLAAGKPLPQRNQQLPGSR
ncbi:MAG: hypothetical protein MZV70_52580 [Desulfobacterales bacterium]|nr:hypothetical protein [Desulfobacterales bacterium]